MIALLVVLVIIGVALWFVGTLPIDPVILNLIRAVAVLCALLLLLDFFGVLHTGLYRWR